MQTHRSWPRGLSVTTKPERLWTYAPIATEHRTWPQGTRRDHITCHICQRALMSSTKCSDMAQGPQLARVAASDVCCSSSAIPSNNPLMGPRSHLGPLRFKLLWSTEQEQELLWLKTSFSIRVQIFCSKNTGRVSRFSCASYKNPCVQGSPIYGIPIKNL